MFLFLLDYLLTNIGTNAIIIEKVRGGLKMPEEKKTFKDTAKYKSNNKYIQNNYRQVKLSMPYTEADALNYYCKTHDLTVAGLIRDLIKKEIGYDSMPFRVEVVHPDGRTEVAGTYDNVDKANQEAKKISEGFKNSGDKETKVHLALAVEQ